MNKSSKKTYLSRSAYLKSRHVVYETFCFVDEDLIREAFADYCDMNDYVVEGTNAKDESGDIVLTLDEYRRIYDEDQWFWFEEWMGYCHNPYDFFVTGQLGLWDCRPTIVPKVFHTLKDAIRACANNVDYIRVELCAKSIKFEGIHHDGTNHFEIRMFNKRAQEMFDSSPCDCEDEVLEKIAANEKLQHSLYEEMFGCWI